MNKCKKLLTFVLGVFVLFSFTYRRFDFWYWDARHFLGAGEYFRGVQPFNLFDFKHIYQKLLY